MLRHSFPSRVASVPLQSTQTTSAWCVLGFSFGFFTLFWRVKFHVRERWSVQWLGLLSELNAATNMVIKPGILQPGQFYSGLDRHVHTSLYNSLWRITLLSSDDVQLVSVQPLASVFVSDPFTAVSGVAFCCIFSLFKTVFAFSSVHQWTETLLFSLYTFRQTTGMTALSQIDAQRVHRLW